MLAAAIAAALAALAWVYLLTCHGGYWLTAQRLPGPRAGVPAAGRWPAVTAVIPARDEADALPASLPTLLRQDYPGRLSIVLVDDESTDGTAEVAAALARAAGWQVREDGAGPAGADPNDADPNDADPNGADPGGADPGGADPGGADPDGADPDGADPDGADPDGTGRGVDQRVLLVVKGSSPPAGWAGKVWAMSQGAARADSAEYLLFTDADIGYGPGAVAGLAGAARDSGRAMVSQMALLRAQTGWEKILVPAFVYFFAQLYPFRRVNRRGGRTAAAAGGCMLVRRETLAAAGGLAGISGARIDDVALGRLLKRAGADCWLGLSTEITSTRPYDRLAALWDMVARSAYTQLRYSPAALAGTIAGLAWLYLLPPAAAVTGVAAASTGGWAAPGGGLSTAGWLAAAGLAGWALMTVSFLPMLALYRLSPLRGLSLPLIALLYAGMTADSARRHHAGRGGEWKGRLIARER
jgi:hopene-associated glycosyltransferase HpnB